MPYCKMRQKTNSSPEQKWHYTSTTLASKAASQRNRYWGKVCLKQHLKQICSSANVMVYSGLYCLFLLLRQELLPIQESIKVQYSVSFNFFLSITNPYLLFIVLLYNVPGIALRFCLFFDTSIISFGILRCCSQAHVFKVGRHAKAEGQVIGVNGYRCLCDFTCTHPTGETRV